MAQIYFYPANPLPVKNVERYASFWQDTAGTKLVKAKTVLRDYCKTGGFERFYRGCWGRSHIDSVKQALLAKTMPEFQESLNNIPIKNSDGALARRLKFLSVQQLKTETPSITI